MKRNKVLILLGVIASVMLLILLTPLTVAMNSKPDRTITLRNTEDQWIVEIEILNRENQQVEYFVDLIMGLRTTSEIVQVEPMEWSLYTRPIRKDETDAKTLGITVRQNGDFKETSVVYHLNR